LLLAFIYLYAFPFFNALNSANEVPRIQMTQELVDHGRLWIDNRIPDRSLLGALDTSIALDGHVYSNKAPGLSFLAVPVYYLCKLTGHTSMAACTWAFRVVVVTIPALVFLFFFYRMSGRFAPEESAKRASLVAYALGSPALVYSILFFSHQTAAVCAGGSFVAAVALVRRQARHPLVAAFVVGLLGAAAIMMDYQSLLAVLIIAIYVLVRAQRRVTALGMAMMGALPAGLLTGLYHQIAFGSPFKTGYSFSVDTSTRRGFMGIVGPSAHCFWTTLFTPSNGIVVLAPWVLLAVVGAIAVARSREARARCGAEMVVCVSILFVYVLFLSSLTPYMARGGWCVGPRYMTVALPFAGWMAAAGIRVLDRSPVEWLLARVLILASVVIFVLGATVYPHWPDNLRNPLFELVIPLLRHGYVPHSLGTLVGLHGFLSLLPLYLTVLGTAFWLLLFIRGRSWRVAVLAGFLAAGIVGAHRAFPSTGPYANRVWSFATSTWEPPVKP
jgi:hypothetical protein